MKKILGLSVIVMVPFFLFSSCFLFDGLFPTELTITNSSLYYNVVDVYWNGIEFGPSQVYDSFYGIDVPGFFAGESQTQDVKPGGDYVSFSFAGDSVFYYTAEFVEVDKREKESLDIDEYTYVLTSATGSQVMTLKEALELNAP